MSSMILGLYMMLTLYVNACDIRCRDNCKLLFGERSCYESCGCEALSINSPIDEIAVQRSNAYIQYILMTYAPKCSTECYGLCGHVLTGNSYANCVENCGCGVILDADLLMQEIPQIYWQGVRPIALRTYKGPKNWNARGNSLALCLNRCNNFCEVVKSDENCAAMCNHVFCHEISTQTQYSEVKVEPYNPPVQPDLPSKDDRDQARQELDDLSEMELRSKRLSKSSISYVASPVNNVGDEMSMVRAVMMQVFIVVSIVMLGYGLYKITSRPKGLVSRRYHISDSQPVTAYRRMVKTL